MVASEAHRRREPHRVSQRSGCRALRHRGPKRDGQRNAGLPPERRIEFRVGIHLGDVVEESDGDLMGDGVNIAARLEGIAEPHSFFNAERGDAAADARVVGSKMFAVRERTAAESTRPD